MVGQRNAAFAEESAEVEVLLASLKKTQDLTKRIKSSITKLDNSGKIVKEAIGPIYSGTQQLQTTARNVYKINEAIEKLRQPIDSKGKEEGIIKAGPKSAGLQQYLAALRRIDKALTDLSSTNIRSNQQAITEFHNLLSIGVDKLIELYRTSLEEDAAKVEPLHYITKDLDFPTYEQDKASYLGQIAAAMISASAQAKRLGRRDDDLGVKIYVEIRGEYMSSSLQALSMACISTSKRRTGDTSVYRQGQNGISTYARGLEGLLASEHDNISRVFRSETADQVFVETSSKALGRFAKTLQELNITIKDQIMTDCFLAYEILEMATPMSYRLESRTGQLRTQLSDAVRPIRDTARASLSAILNKTRAQAESLATLPPDGNTIPLVHDTATRLRNLVEFEKALSSLLTSIGDNGWRKDPSTLPAASSNLHLDLSSPMSPDSSDKLLPNYLSDIVDTLLTSLSARSQAIHRTNRPVQGIFMLNTLAVINRAITSSPELSAYIVPSPNNPKLDGHRKPAQSAYLTAWREPSAHLLDQISTTGAGSRPMSGQPMDSTSIIKSLSSKDKDKIKEKFKNFNQSFDELVARHKSLAMEPEVRAAMGREISAIIEPLYARFWDRYHEVDKGKGKVVKYSKSELAGLLASL